MVLYLSRSRNDRSYDMVKIINRRFDFYLVAILIHYLIFVSYI